MTMKMITKAIIIFFLLFTIPISASEIKDELYKASDLLSDSIYTSDASSVNEAADTASSALKPQNIFLYMTESIKEVISAGNSNLIMMLAVIILCAVTETFGRNLGSCSEITDYVSLLSLMLICFEMFTPLIASVSEYLEKHSAFMLSLTGTSSTLLAASGASGTAAASSVSSAFIISFTQICSVNVILPCVKIIIVLSCVSAISKSLDLSGIINFLKSFCTYGTGLLFAVFLAVHSLALNITSSSDSLAFRSLRFTFARLVPVAGGMISESIRTVLSGMNMIKSAAGGIGTAYIIYTLIPAVFSVLAVKFTVIAALIVSKTFGTKRHTAFLDGINNACTLLFAICIFAAFAGIIILAVFMNVTLEI